MRTTGNDYATRARQLLLNERDTLAYLSLNEHADDFGTCPGCALQLDRYESSRLGHARTCRPLLDGVCSTPSANELKYDAQQRLVVLCVYSFDPTFGLRAFPDATFRIDERKSFYSNETGVQLVVQRQMQAADSLVRDGRAKAGEFVDFTRDTATAIRKQLVPAPVVVAPAADVDTRDDSDDPRNLAEDYPGQRITGPDERAAICHTDHAKFAGSQFVRCPECGDAVNVSPAPDSLWRVTVSVTAPSPNYIWHHTYAVIASSEAEARERGLLAYAPIPGQTCSTLAELDDDGAIKIGTRRERKRKAVRS